MKGIAVLCILLVTAIIAQAGTYKEDFNDMEENQWTF